MCVSGGKKCSFFGKFDVLCFLETPVLRFALLRYYRRFIPYLRYKNLKFLLQTIPAGSFGCMFEGARETECNSLNAG